MGYTFARGLLKGAKLGSYVIEDKLGEGGMGVVYTAVHTRLNRRAVIKVLRKHLADNAQVARRFENEANAAASIGHPGIVEIYDIGQAPDGSLFIVMELLKGESLQERLDRERRLPCEQAVEIVRHCASALAAAHDEGIVHRDLKPDNIFMVADPMMPGGERAKLLDFGIAKLAGDGLATTMTATGAVMGTPHYMSPEQCEGAGKVDHRTDLYALGCILFQMLTGRPPFVEEGVGQYIVAHVTKPPPAIDALAPGVPRAVAQVVSRLLAKRADDRFESASALVEALDAALAESGKPGEAEATPVPVARSGGRTSSPVAATLVADTSPAAAAVPNTTLGDSAAERVTIGDRSGRRWWPALVLGVAVAGGGGYGVVKILDGDEPATSAAPAPVPDPADAAIEMVELALVLDPPNAQVEVDGAVVTDNPLRVEAGVELQLVVRADGHDTETRTLTPTASGPVEVTLRNPEAEARAARAKERRAAWLGKLTLSEGDSESWRAEMTDTDEGPKLAVRWERQLFIDCDVEFQANGDPGRLLNCTSFDNECKNNVRRIESIALDCAHKGRRKQCKWRMTAIAGCGPFRLYFTLRRAVVPADEVDDSAAGDAKPAPAKPAASP